MMMMIISSKTIMMVKVVVSMLSLLFSFKLLSFDYLVSSTSAISSSSAQANNDYNDDRRLRQRTDVNFNRQRRGVDYDAMNDMITDQQQDLLSFDQQMILMRKQLIGNNTTTTFISTTEQNHNNNDKVMSRLLNDVMIQNEKDDLELSFNRRMIAMNSNVTATNVTTTTTGCVRNQKKLEFTIMNSPNNSLIPTTISICKELITMDGSKLNNSTKQSGIHIMNKFINIRCIININKKCIINAKQMSRHFVIINSTVLLTRISFINGKEISTNGGSILISSTLSNIIINQCDFSSNTVGSTASGGPPIFGGAIFCDTNNNIQLNNVNMIHNSAGGYGGAIFSLSHNMQMKNVLFHNNTVTFIGGAVFADGNVDMLNVTFTNNTSHFMAGAIACNNMTLVNSTMTNNNAELGGAIYVLSNNVQMTNVLFANNNARNGGAVHSFGNVDMNNVSFINNTALDFGGAYSASYGNMTLVNSIMANNNARAGGGAIYLWSDCYGNITNSLLHSNSAGRGGVVHSGLATIILNDVVITDNSATSGALSLFDTKVGLKNVVFSSSILDVDECDILFYTEVDAELRISELNLRPPPPTLILQQTQTKQESFAMIATKSSLPQQPLQACVATYAALRRQVRLCSNPCAITICQGQIQMNGSHPINLSNKNIEIDCQLNSSERCMIDGQGLSRLFYGYNATVTFHNIIFANGYSSASGGTLALRKGSFVNLFNCTFVNNSATTGGVITIKNTSFYMTGTQSSFINNTGNSPPLVGYSSDLNLYDTLFKGNIVTKYGNGVLLFDSTIEFYNSTFSESKNKQILNCNVFAAIDPKNLKKGASCLDTSIASE